MKAKAGKVAVTNPVDIISQINAIAKKTTSNKLYGGYNTAYLKKKPYSVDYAELMQKFSKIMVEQENLSHFVVAEKKL